MSKKKNSNNKKSGNNKQPCNKPESKNQPNQGKSVEQAEKESKSEDDSASKEKDAKEAARNDPAWYKNLGDQLYLDVARVYASDQFGRGLSDMHPSFNETEGVKAYHSRSIGGTGYEVALEVDSGAIHYGGIATYKYVPSIGFAKNRNDPANIAAQMLYTNMRSKVSGSRRYQPSDAFIHIAAIADIYTYISICKKIYASAFSFSQINLFIGKSVMQSINIDVDDIIGNLGNFRAWLNSIIKELNAYLVPAAIPYFALKVQSAGSIYLENGYGNIKDQMYQALPVAFYKFTLDPRGKGSLQYAVAPWSTSNNAVKFAQLRAFGESLLASIRNDSDTNDINGDLSRAFPSFVSLETLPDEAYLMPVYDPLMLDKFRNSDPMFYRNPQTFWFPMADPDYKGLTDFQCAGFYVYQNANGELVSVPVAKTDDLLLKKDYSKHNGKHLLNVDAPEITPDTVMEATRYMHTVEDITMSSTKTHAAYVEPDGTQVPADLDGTPLALKYLNCGTEVVVDISFYYTPDTGSGAMGEVSHWRRFIADFDLPSSPTANMWYALDGDVLKTNSFSDQILNALSFKYIPWIATFRVDQVSNERARGYDFKLITQLENYTFIGPDQLRMLHKVALMSLLCPPGVVQSFNGSNA